MSIYGSSPTGLLGTENRVRGNLQKAAAYSLHWQLMRGKMQCFCCGQQGKYCLPGHCKAVAYFAINLPPDNLSHSSLNTIKYTVILSPTGCVNLENLNSTKVQNCPKTIYLILALATTILDPSLVTWPGFCQINSRS